MQLPESSLPLTREGIFESDEFCPKDDLGSMSTRNASFSSDQIDEADSMPFYYCNTTTSRPVGSGNANSGDAPKLLLPLFFGAPAPAEELEIKASEKRGLKSVHWVDAPPIDMISSPASHGEEFQSANSETSDVSPVNSVRRSRSSSMRPIMKPALTKVNIDEALLNMEVPSDSEDGDREENEELSDPEDLPKGPVSVFGFAVDSFDDVADVTLTLPSKRTK